MVKKIYKHLNYIKFLKQNDVFQQVIFKSNFLCFKYTNDRTTHCSNDA